MTKKIHVGCSAYNNSYWESVFYPDGLPRSQWFAFYCRHFNTYELNNTFYRFPTTKILDAWFNKTPEDFLFSVKAPQLITHFKRFHGCRQHLDDFYQVCTDGLGHKLGGVLFQLPPSFRFTDENLALILESLKPGFRNVVEFRNESWWTPEVYDALSVHAITFCSVSYPKLPATLMETNPIGYLRLHGVPKLFYSSYDKGELQAVCREIIQSPHLDEMFVYFNNTASDAGILNAMAFKDLIVE